MDDAFGRTDLVAFLGYMGDKGLANANTAQGLRVAVTKILTDLSPDEEADVRRIDVGLAMRRYINKNPGALSPSSLGEYQRRVATAIREFIAYRADPAGYGGYKGGGNGRGPSNKPDAPAKTPKRKQETLSTPLQTEPLQPPVSSGLPYAYPLRPDFLAQVILPRDLKTEEARRLCAFISTLAVDFSAG